MPEKVIARIGEAIKGRRRELRLSQQHAADAAGIAVSTWGNVEAGRIRSKPNKWRQIEQALKWRAGSWERLTAGEDAQTVEARSEEGGPAQYATTDDLPPFVRAELRGRHLIHYFFREHPDRPGDRVFVMWTSEDSAADIDPEDADKFLRWQERMRNDLGDSPDH